MRFPQLNLEPPKVRITQDEILADLRYPAPVKGEETKRTRR
jgi:hypothetical protein